MIDAAVDALRHNGVEGMSFTDLLATSGAARGAIYHHFPGGKSELVVAAVNRNGRDVRVRLSELPAGTPREIVGAFIAMIRPVVEESTAGSGCAVAAGAMASGGQRDRDNLQSAAGDAIRSWIDVLQTRLREGGIGRKDATELASLLVMTLEGAHVLARAEGRIEPFDRAARALQALVAGSYPG
jgi:AcrR family transcriptional regulator